MDFDEIIYSLLRKVLNLLITVPKEGYRFVMNPSKLVSVLPGGEKQLGPLTYLITCTITFVIVLLVIKWMAKGTNIRVQISPAPKDWQDGLLKLDVKKILTSAMPFVAMVAAHSGTVMLAFKIFGKDVSYLLIFSAGCHFIGTLFLLCTAIGLAYIFILPRQLPRLRREAKAPVALRSPKLWEWILGGLPWIVIIKTFHSYLILLSLYSKTSMWFSIGIWIVGTFGLGFAILAVYIWFKPAIFPGSNRVYALGLSLIQDSKDTI